MDIPAGVQLVRFADANEAQTALLDQHLGSVVDSSRHLFANLSDAALRDGVFVQIDAEADVTKPLHLIWQTTNGETAFTVNQRLLVLCGANSRASLIEHFDCAGDGNAFTNGITELLLEDGQRQLLGGATMRLLRQETTLEVIRNSDGRLRETVANAAFAKEHELEFRLTELATILAEELDAGDAEDAEGLEDERHAVLHLTTERHTDIATIKAQGVHTNLPEPTGFE